MSAAVHPIQAQLAEDIASFTHDPLGFTKYAFPWGETVLGNSPGPRVWQSSILADIGKHLQNPASRHQPCRIAVSSGHGIGKSALIAFVMDWALSTCEDCKVVVTAGTGDQLRTKTVPEVTKWFNQTLNADWWDVQAKSIRFKSAKRQAIWRADFMTWSEENSEAFAGLHNIGKRIVLIFDEASAIAPIIWEVAEGALTDENTEIIWLAFGNPTKNTGRFRECFGSHKHLWQPHQIDARTVEGTNKQLHAEWVELYGEDSDFVRIRVRGEFPRAGSSQFIASDVVAAARKYCAAGYDKLPKILSVDVARFGDDQTVVGTRQGRKSTILAKYRGIDTVQTAERVLEWIKSEEPDATVVDGDGIGAGVIDHLTHRGYKKENGLFEFHGGASPRDPVMYFNKRAEVWGLMRDWLLAGAQIADDPELETDLTSPEYGFSNKQQIQLERKEDMKKRGLASPDCGDMLAMTFAVTVLPKPKPQTQVRYMHRGNSGTGWMG